MGGRPGSGEPWRPAAAHMGVRVGARGPQAAGRAAGAQARGQARDGAMLSSADAPPPLARGRPQRCSPAARSGRAPRCLGCTRTAVPSSRSRRRPTHWTPAQQRSAKVGGAGWGASRPARVVEAGRRGGRSRAARATRGSARAPPRLVGPMQGAATSSLPSAPRSHAPPARPPTHPLGGGQDHQGLKGQPHGQLGRVHAQLLERRHVHDQLRRGEEHTAACSCWHSSCSSLLQGRHVHDQPPPPAQSPPAPARPPARRSARAGWGRGTRSTRASSPPASRSSSCTRSSGTAPSRLRQRGSGGVARRHAAARAAKSGRGACWARRVRSACCHGPSPPAAHSPTALLNHRHWRSIMSAYGANQNAAATICGGRRSGRRARRVG